MSDPNDDTSPEAFDERASDGEADATLSNTAQQDRGTTQSGPHDASVEELASGADRAREQEGYGREGN